MLWKGLIAATALLTSATAAEARWREASSRHFIIYSEGKPDELREFAQTLERYDALLRLLTGGNSSSQGVATRVTVFQVQNVAVIQKLTGSAGIAGFYIPRASGPVAFAPSDALGGGGAEDMRGQAILQHEYAHHFMYLNLPGSYPSWYVEGFAEFAGQTIFDKDGTATIGGAPLYRKYGLGGGAVSVARVLTQAQPPSAIDQNEFYARAWQLTHYLSFAPDRKGQLDAYLKAVAHGVPRPKAATDAFGDLGELTKQAYAYLNQRNLPGVRIGASAFNIGPVDVHELSDGADAVLPIKLVSQRGVNDVQAKALVSAARRAAGNFPADPFAQLALAEAEIDAKNYAEAIGAANRVLAVDAKNLPAMIFRGRALMAQAMTNKATDEATWAEVRRWFHTANRLDPSHPDPLAYNYQSYAEPGQPIPRNAIVGLAEAVRVAPQDRTLRFTLVKQYLVDNDLVSARATLQPAGNDSHGGGAALLAKVWAAIDAGDAKAALAAFAPDTKPQDEKKK